MKDKFRIATYFLRSFFLQSLWNFEQMQNVGFAYCMLPLLRTLYCDPQERRAAVQRQLGFFNTHPYMVSIILGLAMSMEREHAVSHNVRVEEIITIKKNMAGPLAAIGDNFFWGTWRPFVGVMAAGIAIAFFGDHAINWPWAAPLFFVALYNLLSMGFRFWSLKISFNYREQIIRDIAGLRMQSARNAINAIGSIVAALIVIVYVLKFSHNVRDALLLAVFFSGALVCAYVKMSANLVFYGAVAVCIGVAFL